MYNHKNKNQQHKFKIYLEVDSAGNQPDPGDPTFQMLIQDTNTRLKIQFEFELSQIIIFLVILWLKTFSYKRRNFEFQILVHPDTYLLA